MERKLTSQSSDRYRRPRSTDGRRGAGNIPNLTAGLALESLSSAAETADMERSVESAAGLGSDMTPLVVPTAHRPRRSPTERKANARPMRHNCIATATDTPGIFIVRALLEMLLVPRVGFQFLWQAYALCRLHCDWREMRCESKLEPRHVTQTSREGILTS